MTKCLPHVTVTAIAAIAALSGCGKESSAEDKAPLTPFEEASAIANTLTPAQFEEARAQASQILKGIRKSLLGSLNREGSYDGFFHDDEPTATDELKAMYRLVTIPNVSGGGPFLEALSHEDEDPERSCAELQAVLNVSVGFAIQTPLALFKERHDARSAPKALLNDWMAASLLPFLSATQEEGGAHAQSFLISPTSSPRNEAEQALLRHSKVSGKVLLGGNGAQVYGARKMDAQASLKALGEEVQTLFEGDERRDVEDFLKMESAGQSLESSAVVDLQEQSVHVSELSRVAMADKTGQHGRVEYSTRTAFSGGAVPSLSIEHKIEGSAPDNTGKALALKGNDTFTIVRKDATTLSLSWELNANFSGIPSKQTQKLTFSDLGDGRCRILERTKTP